MNTNANYMRSRLSLRRPRAESLEILQEFGDLLVLEKNPDLTQELDKAMKTEDLVKDKQPLPLSLRHCQDCHGNTFVPVSGFVI